MTSRSQSVSLGQLLLLLLGDMAALFLFAAVGRSEHGMAFSVRETWLAAWPFMAAWIPAGVATGLYRARAFNRSYGEAIGRACLAALIAVPLALALRWLAYGKTPFTTFAVASLVFVAAFASAWRLLFSFAARRLRAY
ncbi:MAG: hypothetical protein BLM47_12890 [Candidatus Reconcilbacillus cellulovorans]|uniref:DUF3054 domain-containing protein n=1 Tax=Candidatus Reconcilbacillus cellulovorans TaxID=1906605 RepID=A0A2A6DXQ9_9BACL|nr:MAG: hypothetical protein BLM47_12890 [Candidatus Reconcilbacillus cellulovorans]